MKKIPSKLASVLIEKSDFYNCPKFINDDPIKIPHSFSKKEDIEISAFLSAIIAWGNRTSIIKNAKRLMVLIDNSPYSFITQSQGKELLPILKFVHRTFNGNDCLDVIHSLKQIYNEYGGLENVFTKGYKKTNSVAGSIIFFREIFMKNIELPRTGKHISDVTKGSAAKRLNMFLRWMIRKDDKGVDFGLWSKIPMSALKIPLDVHTGNISRKLGLLKRKQNDWKAVLELTDNLLLIDSQDPVRLDFALFGMGVYES
ncbi:MAG: TIGR02757 family protein [Bacteroidetes bacterium CG23_combo_of_CG06-09_8_20_14_all_32_9]|nr:MAG: TIGR02757 family protein [Bacteroidetes bacterium CG23_combo_of_CG06-09_8_20_14_all_32_9]